MALGEDKGLLACLSSSRIVDEIGPRPARPRARSLDPAPQPKYHRLRRGTGFVLEEFAIANRQKLVLKPAFRTPGRWRCGGSHMFLPRSGDAVYARPVLNTTCLQEYIEAPRLDAVSVLGESNRFGSLLGTSAVASLWGGEMTAVHSRLGKSRVANVTSGAMVQPVFFED